MYFGSNNIGADVGSMWVDAANKYAMGAFSEQDRTRLHDESARYMEMIAKSPKVEEIFDTFLQRLGAEDWDVEALNNLLSDGADLRTRTYSYYDFTRLISVLQGAARPTKELEGKIASEKVQERQSLLAKMQGIVQSSFEVLKARRQIDSLIEKIRNAQDARGELSTEFMIAALDAIEEESFLSSLRRFGSKRQILCLDFSIGRQVPVTSDNLLYLSGDSAFSSAVAAAFKAQDFKSFHAEISKIDLLTHEEKQVALAIYIEKNRVLISDIEGQMDEHAFEALLPYLTYLDTGREAYTPQAIARLKDILGKCAHVVRVVDIDAFDREIDGDTFGSPQIFPVKLAQCVNLSCSGTRVDQLPRLPQCRSLNCSQTLVDSLPDLPRCEDLDCSGTRVDQLPHLPQCRRLNCSETLVDSLPDLPRCEDLDCSQTRVDQLPHLPQCRLFNCSQTSVDSLPDLPVCTHLNCQGNLALTNLGALPVCEDLNCSESPLIEHLPPLPSIRRLDCSGCQSLRQLPEMPSDADVYSSMTPAGEFSAFNVDIEAFVTNPREVLLALGRGFLMPNLSFPNVYYFEKGQQSVVVDVGGVRRDLITRLCENLFKGAGEGFLSMTHEIPQAETPDSEDAYRTLGALMALCYPEASYFKTGPLFQRRVYELMLSLEDPGRIDENWKLHTYLQLIDAPEAAFILADLEAPLPVLEADLVTELTYYMDPAADESLPHDYFSVKANRQGFRECLLKAANEDVQLRALALMATALYERLGAGEWQAIRQQAAVGAEGLKKAAENLLERIQGVLTAEALENHLEWEFSDRLAPAKCAATQSYLIHWIRHAGMENLGRFVRAVSSNKVLVGEKLKISVFDREKSSLPIAHTCFFTLELPGNYPSQEHFDQKLNWLLTEGLAGAGFQVA